MNNNGTNPLVAASIGAKPPAPSPMDTSTVFPKSTMYKLQGRAQYMKYWLNVTKQANCVAFVWSIIWNILALAFTGAEDGFQLWSSGLATAFSAISLFILFEVYPKRKHTAHLNYLTWGALLLVTLLEVIFLVSLIVNGNNYELVKTNYGTLRMQYYHSGSQIILLFAIGIVAVLSLMVQAVAAQRLNIALEGKPWRITD